MSSFLPARIFAALGALALGAAVASVFLYGWRVVVAWALLAGGAEALARSEARSVRAYRARLRRSRRGDQRLLAAVRRMDTVRVFDEPTLEELERNWLAS